MKRTTLYLEPELEVRLKLEMRRSGKPMAEIVREALRAHLARAPRVPPPGRGAFRSRHRDTAEKAETVLSETGFGRSRP
jgi:hypothetical protein